MIRQLDCWYADTDLDSREYAEEYQRIVSGILHGLVILNPKKLALEEVIKEWEVNFTEPEKVGIEQPLMKFVKVKSQLFGTVIT